jgi:hypothetical protein
LKREVPLELAPAAADAPAGAGALPLGGRPASSYAGQGQVAVLFNKRAYRNARSTDPATSPRIWQAMPHSKAELEETLSSFARGNIATIIIAGGDGTVRDVLTRAPRHFTSGMPRLAILPSGKTNALAGDLGLDTGMTVQDVLSTLHSCKTLRRSPLEIRYGEESEPRLRGFVLGTGAFVRATKLAQSVHRAGAVNGLGVALSVAGAAFHTVFGANTNEWRRGDPAVLELEGRSSEGNLFLLLATTLERMPLGVRPFGRVRGGLKLLAADAPPRKVLRCAAALALGSQRQWISDAGCRRADADSFRLRIDGEFVLDGERFPGGDLTISKGAPVEFLVPE